MNAVVSSSDATINTSNAVRRNKDDDDPSIMTFTTAAGTSAGESARHRDNKSGDTIRTRPEACFVHHIGRICF